MNFRSNHHVQSNRRAAHVRLAILIMSAIACTFLASACDLAKVTVNTTSKVLWRAQHGLSQEPDYDLAARAIPGTLKTVEGFWYVDKGNPLLTELLAQGFCQYGIGFIEDEWEVATLARDLDGADYQAQRATKAYVRCTNYALRLLGKKWQDNVYGELDTVQSMLDKFKGNRNALMWLGVGLVSTIKLNKDNIEAVSQLPTAKMILEKVEEIDDAKNSQDLGRRILPLTALGTIYSSRAKALGGEPEKARAYYEKAIKISGERFLLARVYLARYYAVIVQNRELFREQLVKVLQTDPAIWPEQRLANEIAHRRARRYLKHEKEWF